ncbi:hypothetical protein N7532_011130 [Penicillium argentinense]|uniref:Uncharacterized protein n=1 Tax=Penicillium argentinense TaxID=1131581 RepID=A0A9W9EHZ2_9EURO|nr:uncharacterized protein N7532_011130 [Penicillium argentinense]KAJ5082087.1 hypothetical protein N7532_011130 [Penicillium argentinense]
MESEDIPSPRTSGLGPRTMPGHPARRFDIKGSAYGMEDILGKYFEKSLQRGLVPAEIANTCAGGNDECLERAMEWGVEVFTDFNIDVQLCSCDQLGEDRTPFSFFFI